MMPASSRVGRQVSSWHETAVFLFAAISGVAGFAAWPMDGVNPRRTGQTSVHGPGRDINGLSRRWAFDYNSSAFAWVHVPAIVTHDLAIVQCEWGVIAALDVATGALVWRTSLCGSGTSIYTSAVAGPAGIIYTSCNNILFAVNASNGGSVVWSTPIDTRGPESRMSYLLPPLLLDNTGDLYGTGSNFGRYALDASTGVLVWNSSDGTAAVPPVQHENGDGSSVVYGVTSSPDGFRVMSGASRGAIVPLLPELPAGSASGLMSGTVLTRAGHALFVGYAYYNVGQAAFGYVYAASCDVTTGAQQWMRNLTAATPVLQLTLLDPRPLLYEPSDSDADSILLLHDNDHGNWLGLNALTGEQVWSFNGSVLSCVQSQEPLLLLPRPAHGQQARLGNLYPQLASAAVDVDGIVYVAFEGCLYALDARTGMLAWQESNPPHSLGGLIISDANNGSLLISGMYGLFALGRIAGPAPAPPSPSPAGAASPASPINVAGVVGGTVAGFVLMAALATLAVRRWWVQSATSALRDIDLGVAYASQSTDDAIEAQLL